MGGGRCQLNYPDWEKQLSWLNYSLNEDTNRLQSGNTFDNVASPYAITSKVKHKLTRPWQSWHIVVNRGPMYKEVTQKNERNLINTYFFELCSNSGRGGIPTTKSVPVSKLSGAVITSGRVLAFLFFD